MNAWTFLYLYLAGAVLMALSGIWLLFYAFPRRKKKGRSTP